MSGDACTRREPQIKYLEEENVKIGFFWAHNMWMFSFSDQLIETRKNAGFTTWVLHKAHTEVYA